MRFGRRIVPTLPSFTPAARSNTTALENMTTTNTTNNNIIHPPIFFRFDILSYSIYIIASIEIMKLVPTWIKRVTLVEILVSVVFLLYIVLPIATPSALVPLVQSPLGMIAIFLIVLYLFLFAHPLLAVLYLVVAYLLLRRSSSIPPAVRKSDKPPTLPVIPIPKNTHQPATPPPRPLAAHTLEQDVIAKMAPVGQSTNTLVQTSFKPVAANVSGASPI